MQLVGIETFSPWGILDLEVLKQDLKNQTRKIIITDKDFELYQVFMYNFLC